MNDPNVFSNKHALDTYHNPWWGLDTIVDTARPLVERMADVWGPPDLWFNGSFHELLWGPREVSKAWRPSFHVNWSGPQRKHWRQFWLPWRGRMEIINGRVMPFHSNVDDTRVNGRDVESVRLYADFIPFLKRDLENGGAILLMISRNGL